MTKIKVTQIRSKIRSSGRQKRNLEALGLGNIGNEVIHENKANILGMINKVKHLVSVEETK